MTTTFERCNINTECNAQSGPGFPSQTGEDYRGAMNGKPFRVQISPTAAPYWYDSELDDDEKDEVLAAIDASR